ncbi:unnamed protein product [Gemmata massiliana]|uniref:Uncharacterized protein n=1 Tax=Gemmata massiliana TaxID=1210884 RepID=A0A6P2D9I5_9BACT|nr:unnamed protein product [Gemmata massiliana]
MRMPVQLRIALTLALLVVTVMCCLIAGGLASIGYKLLAALLVISWVVFLRIIGAHFPTLEWGGKSQRPVTGQ